MPVSATTSTTRREPTMSERDQKELQKQKMQAKIDEWRAELDKLEAQARGASADARLKLDEQMTDLRSRIDEGKSALAALAEKGEEVWESFKERAASTWDATKAAYDEGVNGSEREK
jgi:chromosome segregation ATPase